MCDSGCVGNSPQARQQSPQGRRPRKRWEATPALVYGGFISPPRSPERYAAFRQMSRSMDSSGPMPNSTYSTLPDSSYSVNSSRTASMNPSYLGSPISPIRRQCVSFDRGRQSPIAMSTRLSYGQDESGRSSRQMDNSHVTEISEEIVESFEDSGATEMSTPPRYTENPQQIAFMGSPFQSPRAASMSDSPQQVAYLQRSGNANIADSPQNVAFIQRSAGGSISDSPQQVAYLGSPFHSPRAASMSDSPQQVAYLQRSGNANIADSPQNVAFMQRSAGGSISDSPQQVAYLGSPCQSPRAASMSDSPQQVAYLQRSGNANIADSPQNVAFIQRSGGASISDSPQQAAYLGSPCQPSRAASMSDSPQQLAYIQRSVNASIPDSPQQVGCNSRGSNMSASQFFRSFPAGMSTPLRAGPLAQSSPIRAAIIPQCYMAASSMQHASQRSTPSTPGSLGGRAGFAPPATSTPLAAPGGTPRSLPCTNTYDTTDANLSYTQDAEANESSCGTMEDDSAGREDKTNQYSLPPIHSQSSVSSGEATSPVGADANVLQTVERDIARREREERKQLHKDLKQWQKIRRESVMNSLMETTQNSSAQASGKSADKSEVYEAPY